MMKKGRKREDKGLAVAHFIIGFVMLLIILGAIYWTLVELDYSDKVRNPEATIRPYVEATALPGIVESTANPPSSVDLTDAGEPTAEPTEKPTATPTPAPTPSPTPVPAELYAQAITSGFNLPDTPTENMVAGITDAVVSIADDNKVMSITGYGYYNDARFDPTQAQTFLVVIPQESPQDMAAYAVTLKAGVSGVDHADAVCQNAGMSDFEVVLDVSQYRNDIYNLELAVRFGDRYWFCYPFDKDLRFTVLDGQVINGLEIDAAEPAKAEPEETEADEEEADVAEPEAAE